MQGLYAFPLDLWQARASDGVSANDCGIARKRQAGLLRKEAHKLRFRDRRVRVGSSSWKGGEAAVHRRLTLKRQVTSTLLPDCAIKPPAAEAEVLP